jgi:hypothetical protein
VTARWLFLFLLLLSSASAFGQTVEVRAQPLSDDDIKLLRQDVQALKDQIIGDTMKFSATESSAFWPVYREYAGRQHAIADRRLRLIIEYAQTAEKMDDSAAANLTERLFQIEDDTQALRRLYFPKFQQALGGKRAAKFYQVDNRLTIFVNAQLASEIPLIP